MEHHKIANLLNDESNKPSKFRTRNWVEINDDIRGAYSPNKQIRLKTAMLRLIILLPQVLLQIILIKK